MTVVESEEPLQIVALGKNPAGVFDLVLSIGETEIAKCDGGGATELECTAEIVPGDFEGELDDGAFVVIGVVHGPGGNTNQAELKLLMQAAPTEIIIITPADDGAVVASDDTDFIVTAESEVGLESLVLFIGDKEIKRCELQGEVGGECSTSFDIVDFPEQVKDKRVEITATAKTLRGREDSVTHTLRVSPLAVRFVRPQITLSNPPRAAVTGISPLELRLVSTHPVEHIKVDALSEGVGLILHKDSNPEKHFRRDIAWGERLGTGEFLLTASILDQEGNQDVAELLVRVSCRNDGDCRGDTRCCPDSGTCHSIVAPGAICDCQNPCPFEQGCFPGICGQAPRRCRPGCFPGGPSDDPSDRAERCDDQLAGDDLVPAHCEKLPLSEVTAENRGGACVPSDPCTIMDPDSCPDLPLDRTLPPGPNNPTVPHTCVPASPTTAKCVPVGSKEVGEEECGFGLCGVEARDKGCQPGLICAFITLDNGIREPARCIRQCAQATDCEENETCLEVNGPGGEPFQTGVCHILN